MAAPGPRRFRRDGGTLTIFVHVQPGARRTEKVAIAVACDPLRLLGG